VKPGFALSLGEVEDTSKHEKDRSGVCCRVKMFPGEKTYYCYVVGSRTCV